MKSPGLRRSGLFLTGTLACVAAVLVWGSIPQGPLLITPPPDPAETGRWVHLEGAVNTRDAGGYATHDGRFVKRGRIYRSGKLNRLTAAGAGAFRRLGVKTVIDFCNRATAWPFFGGDVWSVQLASSVRGCPMSFRKEGPPEEFYVRGVRDNARSYRAAFALMADPERYPVLYHCAAGTDRTGVMSALVLSLAGAERGTILADFRLSEQVNRPGSLRALERLLDDIDAQGGIGPYLVAIGVTPELQDRVRAQLLETRN